MKWIAAPIMLLTLALPLSAGVIVDYVVDAGGNNTDPLNGLAARATFDISGHQLLIQLENTSTGVPAGFSAAEQLVVSLGLNLPVGVAFASGDSAVIGAGSHGLGAWSARGAGDSVAEQWLWSNSFGGDLLAAYRNIVTTSSGLPAGSVGFGGHNSSVGGPYGGIAPNPLHLAIPPNQPAVRSRIDFTLTLTGTLSAAQLAEVAQGSMVEFGSDARYLRVPEPSSLLLVLAPLAGLVRRRG